MNRNTRVELCERIYRTFADRYSLQGEDGARAAVASEIERLVAEASGSHLATELRDVTILLSDLRGFTSMTERLDPLAVVGLLNDYFGQMSKIILSHGGTIDKFMGDAIMVLFGAPDNGDDDVKAAIACAVEMQIAMGDVNKASAEHDLPPLYMGIGINSGQVVAGNLGSELHAEYTVIGDQVNLAARIESHSLRGQVLISEATFERAKQFVKIGQVNELQVKGKKDVIKMYELLSTDAPEYREVPAREGRRSPRVDVDFAVSFHTIDGKSVSEEGYNGRILNMSYGGLLIESPVRLKVFGDVRFPLNLSLSSNQASDVYAKVLLEKEVDGKLLYPLEITSISPEAARTLKLYVDQLVEARA